MASRQSHRKRHRKHRTESASSARPRQSNSSRRQVIHVNSCRVSSNTHKTKISHLGKPPTVGPFHSRLAALMAFFSPQRATTQSSPTREGHTQEEPRKRHGQADSSFSSEMQRDKCYFSYVEIQNWIYLFA